MKSILSATNFYSYFSSLIRTLWRSLPSVIYNILYTDNAYNVWVELTLGSSCTILASSPMILLCCKLMSPIVFRVCRIEDSLSFWWCIFLTRASDRLRVTDSGIPNTLWKWMVSAVGIITIPVGVMLSSS